MLIRVHGFTFGHQLPKNPMSLADTIKSMNEGGGQQAPPADVTPAAQTPTPTPTPAPAATPVAQTTTPAQPAATPTPQAATIPKDPPFVKQPHAQAVVPGTPAPGAQPPASASQEISDEIFNTHLSKLTGGNFKKLDEITSLVERYEQLEEQAKKGYEPKFKDERAKVAYQILTQNAGAEPEAAMRTLRALNFKPEGKSDKDFLFEAYLLDLNNSDLTPLDAQRYFEADYEERYSNIEHNLLQQRAQAQAVRTAKEAISAIQSSFAVADQQPAQISKEVEGAIKGALDNFGGIKMAFTDNPSENDFLTIPVDDPEVMSAIHEEITSPDKAYNDFISQFDFSTQQGYDDLAKTLYMRNNVELVAQKAFEKGAALERVKVLNELSNASNPKDISQVAAPAVGGKQSFLQAWEGAQNVTKP